MSDSKTFRIDELPPYGDVWIDAPMENAGIDARFYGMGSISYPSGINGQAVATVKFNLTAYVKHMIAMSK
jgi:hypothetical protein